MRILYITMDNPAVETILGGMHDETLSGLPAFYYPFKMLLARGCTIDLLLYSSEPKTVVESAHFRRENLIQIRPRHRGALGTLELPLHLAHATRQCLRARHYDFVYGMTEGSHMAVRTAAHMGIPCALRQFGTQEMANVLETIPSGWRRQLRALKDYTYITLSMRSRKNFLLATNDGSRADALYDILGVDRKKFAFYFWRSAVDIPAQQPVVDMDAQGSYPQVFQPLCLSHIGRIADVKRQDRSVRILGELHRRGYPFHLYLVGAKSSEAMYRACLDAAAEYGVADYVHMTGNQPQSVCRQYARNALATLLPGEWNRVNIFYEVMGEGCVVLTNNNHSVDEFIDSGNNCLVYDTEAEAAEQLIALLNDPQRFGMDAYVDNFKANGTAAEKMERSFLAAPYPVEKLDFYFTDADERAKFLARVQGAPAWVVPCESAGVEVNATGVDKGSGLQALCRCLNIPVSAAIAIGDSENDCPMLRDAGLPLAMGNAIDDVKAASEYIMPDCDHDGVAEAIERFLLAQR